MQGSGAAAVSEDVDLGGGFVLARAPGEEALIVATALNGTGALGFASPPEVDARLDADAAAWVSRSSAMRGLRMRSLDQVHGSLCVPAGAVEATNSADAAWTASPNDLLIIRTADCAALWLVDPQRGQIAMVHAGWRGAAGGIIEHTIGALRAQGTKPADIVVAIGPHIGPCCLEVGPEVVTRFAGVPGAVRPASELTAPRQRADSFSLALCVVVVRALEDEGVPRDSIHAATACTRCSRTAGGEPLLHSYRRNGKGGPLMGSVGFLQR